MIERHVTFHLLPGGALAFEAFFGSEYRSALAATPGFAGAELLRPIEEDGSRVMVLRFSSAELALAWREGPRHKQLSPAFKSFYQSSDVRVYDVLAVQPGNDASPNDHPEPAAERR
jgi:heme-degrading monooxygenase HmoA